jgi:hypothetical protein
MRKASHGLSKLWTLALTFYFPLVQHLVRFVAVDFGFQSDFQP